MIKIEKIGLLVGIPGSIITIFSILPDYNNLIVFLIDFLVFLYFQFFSFLLIIKELFLMKIPIILIIVLLFLGSIIYKISNRNLNKNSINIFNFYKTLPLQKKNILEIIIFYNENRKKCTYNRILYEIKQKRFDISNLEANKIINQLKNDNLIYMQEEFMDENYFTLTEFGQEIGIKLIKESQNND